MNLAIWRLEWRLALRRRRLLLLNFMIPLLLVLPISTGGAPADHAAAAYTVLFVLFGTFGSAIPLLREGDGGPLRRVILRGVRESDILAQRVLAGAALDVLELLPGLVMIAALGRAEPSTWGLLLPAVLLALVGANLLGVWVAAVARSIAEGALFASISALFLIHGSGVFRTPTPGSFGSVAERLLPFTPLHELLFEAAGGGSSATIGELLTPFGVTATLFAATLAVSGNLLERITVPAT